MNTVEQVEQEDCQFCPEFLPGEEEKWNKVGPGVQLAGIPACDDCRLFAGYCDTPGYVDLVVERIRARSVQGEQEQGVRWHSQAMGGYRCELCGYDRGKPEEYEVVATSLIVPVYQKQIYYRQEEPDEKTLLCRECLNWGPVFGRQEGGG